MQPIEILEHTADIGLRVRARDLKTLWARAACGFYELLTDPAAMRKSQGVRPCRQTIRLKAATPAALTLAWLRELLFLFSAKGRVFWKVEFRRAAQTELEALVSGGIFNPALCAQRHEVKAVTYHGFKLQKNRRGWMTEIILDI